MDLKPVSVKRKRVECNADLTSFVRVPQADSLSLPKKPSLADSSTHALIGGLLEPLTGPSCSDPGVFDRN